MSVYDRPWEREDARRRALLPDVPHRNTPQPHRFSPVKAPQNGLGRQDRAARPASGHGRRTPTAVRSQRSWLRAGAAKLTAGGLTALLMAAATVLLGWALHAQGVADVTVRSAILLFTASCGGGLALWCAVRA